VELTKRGPRGIWGSGGNCGGTRRGNCGTRGGNCEAIAEALEVAIGIQAAGGDAPLQAHPLHLVDQLTKHKYMTKKEMERRKQTKKHT